MFILIALVLFVIVAGQIAVAAQMWGDAGGVVARAEQRGALRVPAGPEHFTNAERTIAINDFAETWGQHSTPCRTLDRAWSNLIDSGAPLAGMPVSGFVARDIVGPSGDSIRSQVRRILVACQLERRYDDVQLFRILMTRAYFGQNLIGLEAASQAVFSKPASALNAEEAAKLAVLWHSPGVRQWPDKWTERANAISQRVAARSR